MINHFDPKVNSLTATNEGGQYQVYSGSCIQFIANKILSSNCFPNYWACEELFKRDIGYRILELYVLYFRKCILKYTVEGKHLTETWYHIAKIPEQSVGKSTEPAQGAKIAYLDYMCHHVSLETICNDERKNQMFTKGLPFGPMCQRML